jgi:hypothetical protein
METEKKRKGRPPQARNTIQSWQFVRAARVMCAYDEARERGDKHSVAVRGVVEHLKQSNPGMPISQTEVKRILAVWRPRNAGTILRFERNQELTGPVESLIARFAERPNYPRHNRKIR